MNNRKAAAMLGAAALFAVLACKPVSAHYDDRGSQSWEREHEDHDKGNGQYNVQLGPRPYYLVDNMDEGKLKKKLQSCSEGPFEKTDFAIGHRGGGTLQFPEETRQSYEAGARMGAGISPKNMFSQSFNRDDILPTCRE